MPLGPFGEVVGTTGTLEALGPDASNYKSKVIAPRNPKLLKDHEEGHKVWQFNFCIFYLAFDIHGLFQTLKLMFKDNSQTLYVYLIVFIHFIAYFFKIGENFMLFSDDTQQVFIWHANEYRTKTGQYSYNENPKEDWTSGYGWYKSAESMSI